MEPLGTLLGCATILLGQQIQQKAISSNECACVFMCAWKSACLCAGQQQNADSAAEGQCAGLNWQILSTVHTSTLLVSTRIDRESRNTLLMLFHRASGTALPNSALAKARFRVIWFCVYVFSHVLPYEVGNHISHSAESLFLSTSTMSRWDSFPQSEQSNLFLYWCENCRESESITNISIFHQFSCVFENSFSYS